VFQNEFSGENYMYFDLDQDKPNVHSQKFSKWLDENKEVNVIKIEIL
jgi:hypothetical protein